MGKETNFIQSIYNIFGREEEAIDFSSVNKPKGDSFVDYGKRLQLLPLFLDSIANRMNGCKIELVENETWKVSSGLAKMWKLHDEVGFVARPREEEDNHNGQVDYESSNKQDLDFDDIEDMRVRGNLFYKLDKDSKEYEEYKFDFHRRKSSKSQNDQRKTPKRRKSRVLQLLEMKRLPRKKPNHTSRLEKFNSFKGFHKNELLIHGFQLGGDLNGKTLRTPPFNQLTAPYHEPFCLDIYVSIGSVRACYRATSKVVSVAHSISKDMKFDLGSTKNKSTSAAVGKILAQRTLVDAIHNVVYTPRKGEILQGRLQIVLQSIIDHGINKGSLFQQKLESNAHRGDDQI
ncbi:hypothetical protein M9H77_35166 [Catharanthus roseus]|uniref:Uncharacterized protein n=1 Tax=Catharanthus roseus TaxID=4058 RepID=A0ACB9ZN85_CATRO|nr:hypothetical protein M9H77_35166 [Catharanthus roseus]